MTLEASADASAVLLRALDELARRAPSEPDAALRQVAEVGARALGFRTGEIWVIQAGGNAASLRVCCPGPEHAHGGAGAGATAREIAEWARSGNDADGGGIGDPVAVAPDELWVRVRRRGETAGILRFAGAAARHEPTLAERLFAAALSERAATLLGETALRDREMRLAEVQSLARIGSWEWNTITNAITWSDEQLRIHGLERHEQPRDFVGFLERVHPDDREPVLRACEQLLQTGAPFSFVYRMVRPDGAVRWLSGQGQMLTDEAGDRTRMVGTAQDITERKQMEDALRASTESYRTLFQHAAAAMWVHDIGTGDFLEVNEAAVEMYGYEVDEMKAIGVAGLSDGRPPYTIDIARAYIERAAAGHPQRFEWLGRHKDGSEVWGEVTLRRVDLMGVDRILATARDITHRKRAEEALLRANEELERRVRERTAELAAANDALRQSEEKFRALIENAHDITCIVDEQGVMRYQSPSLERILGWPPDELIGRNAFDFIHPEDGPRVAGVIGSVLSSPGTSVRVEYRFRHRDGTWRQLEAFGRTLSADSADHGIVANIRDVTERRQAEAALERARTEAERAREEAERANRAKSEFLSRMSHELRTPMNSILGFAQVLARGELRTDQERAVGHISKAGKHLLRLINEVLEIARIEAGRQSMSIEPVPVGAVLREAVGLIRPLASQNGTRIEFEPRLSDDTFVRADRQRLVQILLNLLSNGIKYNRAGGQVEITCVPQPADDANVVIRVADTGRGIAAEHVHQLFTPFARLGAERGEVEGTGLGLALSQRMAEAMGGSLSLESTSPEGSTFRLELRPARSPRSPAQPASPPSAEPIVHDYDPATLLYIEDNLANLSLVETFLEFRPGWRVVPALQGGLGLELARETRPDLILLDLHLPDMHGEDVLRRLRADPRTSRVPVVIISADATRSALERLRRAGAKAYLTKPLDMDEFLTTIELQLSEARARR
jgi:PAS domain S-box-containing protein